MHHLSNLPPGCTDRAIEEQAGALDEADTHVLFCAEGEAYCRNTEAHQHCVDCGSVEHDAC